MTPSLAAQLESRPLLRYAFAAASGVALAWSMPEPGVPSLAFVAIAPLICAAMTAPRIGDAFLAGWLALSIAWLVNVPWVITVMETHGGISRGVGILLHLALALFLGLYGGLFALAVHRLTPMGATWRWALIPFAWALVEFARAHLFSGFPWNLLAVTVIDSPAVMVARVAGPYAIGAMIVVPSVILARTLLRPFGMRMMLVALAAVASWLIPWALAGDLLARAERSRIAAEKREIVALIQPDISQEVRWDSANVMTIFDRMISMSGDAAARGAELIVWPESTVPLRYDGSAFYREAVEAISRDQGLDVILGSVAAEGGGGKVWNSAHLVSSGVTVARYDKVRLVPFGEYVPLRKLLFFAEKLVKEVGEFSPGTRSVPLSGRHVYGMAICYEIVFPSLAGEQVRGGAEVLVTVTNDGWFGRTAAPRQHFDSARLRAVETGRWLARAATTGISAIVDPTGRVVEELGVGQRGIIVGEVGIRNDATPYTKLGDWFVILAALVVAAGLIVPGKVERS